MNQFLNEILEQPQALHNTGVFACSEAGIKVMQSVCAAWHSGKYDRIVLTGMGSSNFLSHAGAVLLSGAGIPALAVNAGELLHFQLSLLTEKTLLVAISQSGESYEVVELLKWMRQQPVRPWVVGITNEAESTLAMEADCCLSCRAGKELMTSTKTFITSYGMVWQLVETLKGHRVETVVWQKLADEISRLLETCDSFVEKAVSFLEGHSFIQTIGRGVDWATAAQTALMFMEATKTPSSALLGGEFRHGPLEMVNEHLAVVIYAHSQSGVYDQSVKLAQDVLKFGGKVIWVSDERLTEECSRLLQLQVCCQHPELFLIPSILPLQLIVNARAEAAGLEPGSFLHGAKVTAIE